MMKKRILALIFAVLMIISTAVPSFAVEASEYDQIAAAEQAQIEELRARYLPALQSNESRLPKYGARPISAVQIDFHHDLYGDANFMHGEITVYANSSKHFFTEEACYNFIDSIYIAEIDATFPLTRFHAGTIDTLEALFFTVGAWNSGSVTGGGGFAENNIKIEKINVIMTQRYYATAAEALNPEILNRVYSVFSQYAPDMYITRSSSFTGPIITVQTPMNQHFVTSDNIVIDNRVPYPNETTVAVEVDQGGCFMMEGGKITNSLSGANKDQYAGIGVQLLGPTAESGGALELWYDCMIEKCFIGSDQRKGITRLKDPIDEDNHYTIADNRIAVNVTKGTTIGKWTEDISWLNEGEAEVIITLENPENWNDGDEVFTAGFINQESTNNTYVITPVYETDIDHLVFANREDLNKSLSLTNDDEFTNDYTQGWGGVTLAANPMLYKYVKQEHEAGRSAYNVIKFYSKCVYNIRTEQWYMTLYEAVNATDFPLQDDDTLVFYADTLETRQTTVHKNNITIRAATLSLGDTAKGSNYQYKDRTARWRSIDAGAKAGLLVDSNRILHISCTNAAPEGAENRLTFNLNGNARGILANGGANVTIGNFTVMNGSTSGNGGGIDVEGATTKLTCGKATEITANRAANGGGIYNNGATVLVNGSDVSGNNATNGGGIYNVGKTTANEANINNNSATNGGAVYQQSGTSEITKSNVKGNKASGNGAGIYETAGTVDLKNDTVETNMSNKQGGAIYLDGGNCNVTGGTYYVNAAGTEGGMAYINANGILTVDGATLTANDAGVNGDGVYQGGKFILKGAAVFNNKVANLGGTNDVYLPTANTSDAGTAVVRVINDEGYTGSSTVLVTLGVNNNNQYDGRNYVEGSGVTEAKLAKYSITNLVPELRTIYFAEDKNGKVLELDIYPDTFIKIVKEMKPGETVDPDQTFVFHIVGADDDTKGIDITVMICGTGTATVSDLPIGKYTVNEVTEWSVRYKPDTKTMTKTVNEFGTNNTFTFVNTKTNDKYLTGDCVAENVWSGTTYTRVN